MPGRPDCRVSQTYRRLLVLVSRAEHKLKYRAGVTSAFCRGRTNGSQGGYAYYADIGLSRDAHALGCMLKQVDETGHWVASGLAALPARGGWCGRPDRSGGFPAISAGTTGGAIAGQAHSVTVRRLSGPDNRKG